MTTSGKQKLTALIDAKCMVMKEISSYIEAWDLVGQERERWIARTRDIDKEIARLKLDLTKLEKHIQEIENSIYAKRMKIKETSAYLDSIHAVDHDKWQGRNAELEREIESLQNELDTLF